MARGKDPSAARRPRRYVHDPHHPGLARSFARWAQRQGLAITRLSEEQRTVLEAVRRFLAWSGPRPVFRRLAFFFLLHVGLRFPRPVVQAVLGRAITDKSVFRGLTAAQAAARLTAPDRRAEAGAGRRRLGIEHVGPIARCLTTQPTTVVALHRWITTTLGIPITRPRLYPALRRLGLAALLLPWGQRKKGALHAPGAPSTPALSS